MNRTDQIRFVRELCGNIQDDVIARIKRGDIPEEWDGHELRVWLAEKFEDSASMSLIRREPRTKRAREYRNHVLVNCLT